MDRPRPVQPLLAACAVVVALAATSCSDDDDSAAVTSGAPVTTVAPTAASTAAETSPVATSVPTESTALETTAVATTAVATTEAPATTAAPTTAEPATTAAPTTLAPIELLLRRDGLGVAAFGTEADTAVAATTTALGEPTEDTGWVDPLTISTCAGPELRRVSWGVLSLLFGDPSGGGARNFFSYSYGDVAGLGGQPAGLRTPEGLGLGTPVADLRVAYPAVTLNAGEEGLVESSFFVDDALAGLLTGATDTDSVTVIFGGPFCG